MERNHLLRMRMISVGVSTGTRLVGQLGVTVLQQKLRGGVRLGRLGMSRAIGPCRVSVRQSARVDESSPLTRWKKNEAPGLQRKVSKMISTFVPSSIGVQVTRSSGYPSYFPLPRSTPLYAIRNRGHTMGCLLVAAASTLHMKKVMCRGPQHYNSAVVEH